MADDNTNNDNEPVREKEVHYKENDGGSGWAVAIIVLLLVLLFIIFILPMLGGDDAETDTNVVPDDVNIDVDTPAGTGGDTDANLQTE